MYQKVLLGIIGLSISLATLAQQKIQPNFELWNKHTQPLYYSVSNSIQEASSKPLQLLRPGKWTDAAKVDTSRPTVIAVALDKQPQPGQNIDIFTIKPNKTMFIRVGLPAEKEKFKETLKHLFGKTSIESDNYIFGGQVGPLLGIKGISERGYSLKNNVNKNDITKSSVIYRPKQ